MASGSLPYKRRKDVFSDPSISASEPRSINDLPDEVLLNILSYFGPEDLHFVIAEVCERWNALAKDVALWKNLSYECEGSDISDIEEVRCTALLVFGTNDLKNVAPSSILNVRNLKESFRNWISFNSE
jgi:hypothetical protein